jgi:hypothetical protein
MTTFELAVLIAAVLAFGLSGAVLALFGVAEGRPCVRSPSSVGAATDEP